MLRAKLITVRTRGRGTTAQFKCQLYEIYFQYQLALKESACPIFHNILPPLRESLLGRSRPGGPRKAHAVRLHHMWATIDPLWPRPCDQPGSINRGIDKHRSEKSFIHALPTAHVANLQRAGITRSSMVQQRTVDGCGRERIWEQVRGMPE